MLEDETPSETTIMSSVSPTQSLPPPSTQASEPSSSFLTLLLKKMHPSTCLSAVDPDLPLDVAVPMILADLDGSSSKKKREHAVQTLYGLTDQKHRHYRVELVTKYKIVDTLVQILAEGDHRRMALLTLNNLAIPLETKPLMLDNGLLLKELYAVLKVKPPADTYLACLCLRNLVVSFDATHGQRLLSWGGDLLGLIQDLFVAFAPRVIQDNSTAASSTLMMKKNLQSAEGLALKWSAGLVRQVVTEAPELLNQQYKDLVRLMLELISQCAQHVPLHDWTVDSLPDSCLVTILSLAKSNNDCTVLRELNAAQYLSPLIGKGGIHDTRASWIQCCLEGL